MVLTRQPLKGPLSWAIPAELFGTAMRLKGVSVGGMTSFAFNTMIGQITPIAVSSIGWKYYVVFIVCNLTNGIFFWAFLPETKGLHLEDMDELFFTSPTFIPWSSWEPKLRSPAMVASLDEKAGVEEIER